MSQRRQGSVVRNLAEAWRTITDDPLGILLPAAASLGVEVGTLWMLRLGWWRYDDWPFAAFVAVLVVARMSLIAPFRALLIDAGAAAQGIPSRGWRRAPALAGVQIVVTVTATSGAAIVLLPALGLAAVAATYGWFSLAAVTAALGVVGATLAVFGVRVLFATAPIEAVVAGRSGLQSLRHSARRSLAIDRVGPAVVLIVGDLAVTIGGMACGAGALPGYPMSDLALLHRWRGRPHHTEA